MEALDSKIFKELQSLPVEFKKQVLDYIGKLKSKNPSVLNDPDKDEQMPPGYGNASEYRQFIPDNLDQISVSEDFEDYI